jgi:hypothetical protein
VNLCGEREAQRELNTLNTEMEKNKHKNVERK